VRRARRRPRSVRRSHAPTPRGRPASAPGRTAGTARSSSAAGGCPAGPGPVSWALSPPPAPAEPYLDVAVRAGDLGPRDERDARAACALIRTGAFDDDEPPARIHGDLWNGNVLWTAAGVVIIDPAAHGGHRETDLAMLALFGAPYLDDIVAGYERERPLRAGWRDRVPLHQLHPLAVHAAGHGPAYGRALGEAARAVLALAD